MNKTILREDYESEYNQGYQDAIKQLQQKLNPKGKASSSNTTVDDIGGTISSAIIDMEDAQREAEAIADQLDDEENKELKDKVEDAGEQAGELKKELEKKETTKGGKGGSGGKHREIDRDTIAKDIQIRAQKIKDFLNDAQNKINAQQDDVSAIRKEREEKQRKDYEKWFKQRTDLRFLSSLDKLVKTQTARHRESTWRRPSKNVVPGSDVLRKGRRGVESKTVPLVAVFYDRSGSWDEEKTAVGDKAISMLTQNYEKRGLIKLQLFFFADNVSSNEHDPELGGGTSANQLILDKINQIRATNVIIITDSDMDSTDRHSQHPFTGKVTKVPGGVYFLFKGGRCSRIMQVLKGETLTEAYDL